jgi:peptide/nickel transport system permease protein
MSVVSTSVATAGGEIISSRRSAGVWKQVAKRLRGDALGMASLVVVLAFVLLSLFVALGWVASGWSVESAVPYAPPDFLGPDTSPALKIEQPTGPMLDLSSVDPLAPHYADIDKRAKELATAAKPKLLTLPFGADRSGRDVLLKAIKGSEVSIFVGLAAAVVATALGTFLGALAGFFGGIVGDVLEWFYNVFTAVPGILLIFAFAAVLGRGIGTVVVILGLTGWTSVYRLLRAEYIKHSTREYVLAAQAIGTSRATRMFVHILPNVSHVILVQMSLNVVFFIKAEVILSFLGLGVPIDSVSWGTMLNEAQAELILGKWWQLVAATVFMAVFVTAFSVLTDALRDALDPKLR